MPETISQAFQELHFRYLEQFLVALLPMAITVLIHAQGIGVATRYFKRFGRREKAGSTTAPHVFVVVVIVAIMLATHFLEVCAWAYFYFLTGMLASITDAMTYSINAYTTLGATSIDLPGRWKGLGGFEAIAGMLMFGWSTAVLVTVVQKLHSIDS